MTGSGFEFREVSKKYREAVALSSVSFRLAAGQHTALLGPSGSGKSTALRLIAGLETPSSGQLLLNSQVISKPGELLLPPHRRGITMVFQDLALWPNLTVLDNVLLGLAGSHLPRLQAQTRAHEMLMLCGIEALAERKPGQISGGEQQRVALARALATSPNFLLLDEPFSGLDPVIKSRLLQDLASMARDRTLAVLLVTHDPLDAIHLCRFAVVLEKGRVTETGVLAELLNNPQSEILRTFKKQLGGLSSITGLGQDMTNVNQPG